MEYKTQVVRKDFLVLVIDTRTGKVSTDGGPFRELKFPVPVEVERPTPPEKGQPGPPPVDDYVCARHGNETPADCMIYQRVNGVYYYTGIGCANHPACQIIP